MAGGSLAAGATPNRLKRKAPASSAAATSTSEGEEEAIEEEIEELEREVADLGRRILDHRRDAAARFAEDAVSRLVALRPPPFLEVPSEPQSIAGWHAGAEQQMLEKLKIIKSKLDPNVAVMHKLLKNLNGCAARMEKLEQLNVNIHPVFQRKR
ncbi:uncharacterized protein LOC100842920 [Brachypodium distachyon]|uniref:Uncharacterized protein n=1 Tax=Brachypodium distachyon TaxID=15368 RepID=I1J0H6_BRADI|nr:uncharacterized protein LOC100842920 [Brachypodium distachyon]KQJ84004.1 hypothetical protein BRADI_5g18090v3 [Brachypodium distachyon]|eukprot:XP_003580307.1 uncharacterized protein LOC100842920 [Brachypodium distachyon]